MKITILAIGTTGDVRPLIALGLRLREAGHEVCIATDSLFGNFVSHYQLEPFLIKSNIKELHEKATELAAFEIGKNPLRLWREAEGLIKMMIQQVGPGCWEACQSAEAIVCSLAGAYFAPHISERLNVPSIPALFCPMTPTREFPSKLIPTKFNLGGTLNRLTWILDDIITILAWLPFRTWINQWRVEQLNLQPLSVNYFKEVKQLRRVQKILIYAFSPSVVPKPPDWDHLIHITGYLFLDRSPNWQPPADLVDFLSSGPPPVYIGFGSMIIRNPEGIMDIILRALERTKQRGVIAAGWGGLGETDLPDNVFQVESVPHDWLFPQMAAVIHHGGAGTTASGLRAGIASIVVPIYGDQPFWGRRVASLGVGPDPIPLKLLSVERLENAITDVIHNKEIRRRAAVLGERIRSEDGMTWAVEVIQKHLFSSR